MCGGEAQKLISTAGIQELLPDLGASCTPSSPWAQRLESLQPQSVMRDYRKVPVLGIEAPHPHLSTYPDPGAQGQGHLEHSWLFHAGARRIALTSSGVTLSLSYAAPAGPLTGRGDQSTTSDECCGRCRRHGRRSRAPPPSLRAAAARRSHGPAAEAAQRAPRVQGRRRGALAAPAGAEQEAVAPAGPPATDPVVAAGRRSTKA